MIQYEWYLKHIQEYLTAVYDTYAGFMPAVFTTYYQNKVVQFDELSHAGYTSPSKSFSPNRYTKLIGVPVFMAETVPHVMEVNESGVVETNQPTTITMMGRIGFTPRNDDHVVFPAPIGETGLETLYRVTNVEPAMLNVKNPFKTDMQAWRVTISAIDDPASTIEAKVMETFVYIDRYAKLLSPNDAVVYVDSLSLYKELENYLAANQDRISYCLQYNNTKFYDATIAYMNLVDPDFSTYQPSFLITPFDATAFTTVNADVFHTVLDETSTSATYTSNYTSMDSFILQNKNPEAMRRLYRRRVYLSADNTSEVEFFNLFYPNDTTAVQSYVNHIIQNKMSHTYTVIPNTTHNVAVIHNKWCNWYNTRTSTLRTSWSNIFEALLLYKYTGDALWILINE